MTRFVENSAPLAPLEQFVRDYVEARDGAWDEIEPQVYDLLIGPELIEVAFNPEALPEHPRAQLASFGSPLIDKLLNDASERWRSVSFHRVGLNLHPHDLESRVRRPVSLPAGASLDVADVRCMNFPQAIFWFTASFVSDQKEEEILPVGIDLHYQREVRHPEAIMAPDRLSAQPQELLPEAPHPGITAGYRAARRSAARTVTALGNARRREWASRADRQIERMRSYYAQLRREAAEHAPRSADPAAIAARAQARRDAIDQEELLRISELRQKSAVRVSIRLSSLMLVRQPKLLIAARVSAAGVSTSHPLEMVWDPLSEALEAIQCPNCAHPTFEFQLTRFGLRCAHCRRS